MATEIGYQSYDGAFPNWINLSGNIIATTAKQLAYPKGTAKKTYTYGKGKATAAFTTAINKVYAKRSSWSKQCQAGASCDVGAGTILRYCGAAPSIPRGLEEQIPFLKKNNNFKDMGISSTVNFKPGDVGIYLGKKKGAHIWICLDGGIIAEANHTAKYFEHLIKRKYTSSNKKYFACFRMITPIRTYMKRGDMGSEIVKLQNFLNWAGFDCGKVDGDFGAKTEAAVMVFQLAVGLKADGVYGEQSQEKAMAYKKEVNIKSVEEVAQEVLDGVWGSGEARKERLIRAGYNYEAVQAKVTEIIKAKEKAEEEAKAALIEQIALEVIEGKWGSGNIRKEKLAAAGYDYDVIQAKVNELIKNNPSLILKGYEGTFPSLNNNIKIANGLAYRYCYPYGTAQSKYKYATGKPKPEYAKGIDEAYPNHKSWSSPRQKVGACCDIFTGTVLAHVGIKVKKDLKDQLKDMPKMISQLKSNGHCKAGDFKLGDVVQKGKKDYSGHTWIVCELVNGKKYIANSHYKKLKGCYAVMDAKPSTINPKKWKYYKCYTIQGAIRTYYKKDDYGYDVLYIQQFLKWYGYDISCDGDFGPKTEAAVKQYQTARGLAPDGLVGAKTIEDMKNVKK